MYIRYWSPGWSEFAVNPEAFELIISRRMIGNNDIDLSLEIAILDPFRSFLDFHRKHFQSRRPCGGSIVPRPAN